MTAPALALEVLGTGSALPGEPVTSGALLERLRSRFGIDGTRRGLAIARRLGIRTRYLARSFDEGREAPRPGCHAHDLASEALVAACVAGGLNPAALSHLFTHSATPSRPLPGLSADVCQRLGVAIPHTDLRQACTGFAGALVLARALAGSGVTGGIGIAGAEVGSTYFTPESLADSPDQWVNLMQMGDGAGAVVVRRAEDPNHGPRITQAFYGVLPGTGQPAFHVSSGGSSHPWLEPGHGTLRFLHDAPAVRELGRALFAAGIAAAADLGIGLGDADWIVPHQANGRIAGWFGDEYGVDPARVFVCADETGNTGSAAMWIAFDRLRRDPRVQPGDRALFLGAEAPQRSFGGFLYVQDAH